MSPFQQKLLDLKKRIEGNLTPKYLKVLNTAIRNLEKSGMKNQVLKVGDHLPGFTLINQRNQVVNSKDLLLNNPLIITFYRGFWCPFCNADMANLQTYMSDIESLGATLVAISPEKPEYSQRIIKRQRLTFDILFDQRNQVAAKFGLIFKMSDDLMDLYLNKFHYNLKVYHGDDDWTLPVPARFLIDTDGVIRYAESTPDYTTRPDPDDLMEVLKKL